MPGIEDKPTIKERLAEINAIKAGAEARKTAEKEKTAKESTEKRAGLEQEKAQVEEELVSVTVELQDGASEFAKINNLDLSDLDSDPVARGNVEKMIADIAEELNNLNSRIHELTKRKLKIDEELKGATGETEKGLDEGVAESKEEKADNSPELATKEDPELTKLGNDSNMIDIIHGFKFVYSDGLRLELSKATRNKDAIDIKAIDRVINTGNEMIKEARQSPERIAQAVKEYVNGETERKVNEAKKRHEVYAIYSSTARVEEKIVDLKILPQTSLDTIIKQIQARVDDAKYLKQKEEDRDKLKS